jgi:S1-C subfamily serine protease
MQKFLSVWLFVSLVVFPIISPAADESETISKIFKEKSDAVVMIAVASSEGDRLGSGFFISRNGKIVTNYHLIRRARKIVIKLKSGLAFVPRRVINLEPEKDIAVIQIEADSPVYFKMGNSNSVIIGQKVLTIGNPQGLESTVSDGLISSIRVNEFGMKMFQVSVPLSTGSSGGPLIDLNGEVIGITTAGMSNGQNLNFAVPINYVQILLRKPFDAMLYTQPWQSEKPRLAPSTKTKTKSKPSSREYVVKKGDSLYNIAKRFRTSVKELQRINRLEDPKIVVGQRLTLP